MRRTVVAFHAHPDDEALLTAGTMARAAAEGHRVVLVLATDGDPYARSGGGLGARRLREAHESARILGVARTVNLGYADSGMGPEALPTLAGRARFTQVPVTEAAGRLAKILREESADVLLSHDRNGGYGHRDHVRVHRVAGEAARLAGTRRVLEATVPRDTICRVAELVSKLGPLMPKIDRSRFRHFYSARSDITHRICVRKFAAQKRASLRSHASQTSIRNGADRTLRALLLIPRPFFDLVLGQEWFVDPGHRGPVSYDIFAGLP
jgi:LmbE family N-acetylglucosaminyl deacetylase